MQYLYENNATMSRVCMLILFIITQFNSTIMNLCCAHHFNCCPQVAEKTATTGLKLSVKVGNLN